MLNPCGGVTPVRGRSIGLAETTMTPKRANKEVKIMLGVVFRMRIGLPPRTLILRIP
jgi:hypothetical protein